jgi:LmbE family N-acetylglucosaminyl deacetylase
MNKELRIRPATLLAVCGVAVAAGAAIANWPQPVALAQTRPAASKPAPPPNDGKLRIVIFGAHPDDAEYRGAGVAMKWAKAGHHVKLVSATNGDIGHWESAGGPLALRRIKEVQEVSRKLGTTAEVLDIHDGEILPTLENRKTFTRVIREWNADIVIANRPNDYHPDHRYTSILVQDSAYMVTVPFFNPDIPHLKKNPVYLYTSDRFERPSPFRADIAVSIDEVMEPTLDALLEMQSQIHEGGANGDASLYPNDANARARRDKDVRANLARRYASQADQYRATLTKYYGDAAKNIKYAQAFEIVEYGRRPTAEEIKKLFPF